MMDEWRKVRIPVAFDRPVDVRPIPAESPDRLKRRYTQDDITAGVLIGPDAGRIWDVRSLVVRLSVTDVGNPRGVVVYINERGMPSGNAQVGVLSSTYGLPALQTGYYCWSKGGGDVETTTTTTNVPFIVHSFPDLYLHAGMALQPVILANQAGDTIDVRIIGYEFKGEIQ